MKGLLNKANFVIFVLCKCYNKCNDVSILFVAIECTIRVHERILKIHSPEQPETKPEIERDIETIRNGTIRFRFKETWASWSRILRTRGRQAICRAYFPERAGSRLRDYHTATPAE